MRRREVVMLGAAALCATPAWTQPTSASTLPAAAPADFPQSGSTLRVIVPAAPGGLTSVIAKLVEEPLARRLNVKVTIEHQPGQGGQGGASALTRAAPDGYTLLAVTLGHAAQALLPGTAHDLRRELKPVALLASSPVVLVVPAASRVQSAADLLRAARSSRLTGASSGNGTPAHLTLALYNDIAKTSIVHLPQAGGVGAVDAVLAGRADLTFADMAEALPHIASGRVRALAIASVARHPRLPEVPTTTEVGMPTLLVENWTGLMAPVKTPDLIVDKLDSELVKVMLSPEVDSRATAAGLRVDARAAGKFAAFLEAETTRWSKLIGSAEIRPK